MGKRLPLSAIVFPLNISFPLYRQPSLDVNVWGRGVPDAARGSVLAIKVANVTGAPVEITGVYAGSIYGSRPIEVFYGGTTVKLPLHELQGERQPPCVLRAGESALWTANLRQLANELGRRRLTLSSGSHDAEFDNENIGNPTPRERLAVMVRNRMAMARQNRMAVVVEDGRGVLHKAKVRWQPPTWAMLGKRRFTSAVNEVEIFEDLLIIHPRGGGGVALVLDFARIVGVEADPEVARARLENPERPNAYYRHTGAGEPYFPDGDTAFFNVQNPKRAVKITLRDERYAGLVIEVQDPLTTVKAIREAIGKA